MDPTLLPFEELAGRVTHLHRLLGLGGGGEESRQAL